VGLQLLVVDLLVLHLVVLVDRGEPRLGEHVVELDELERDGLELDLVELEQLELHVVELEQLELGGVELMGR
jgi:hypothetical protein